MHKILSLSHSIGYGNLNTASDGNFLPEPNNTILRERGRQRDRQRETETETEREEREVRRDSPKSF